MSTLFGNGKLLRDNDTKVVDEHLTGAGQVNKSRGVEVVGNAVHLETQKRAVSAELAHAKLSSCHATTILLFSRNLPDWLSFPSV